MKGNETAALLDTVLGRNPGVIRSRCWLYVPYIQDYRLDWMKGWKARDGL